MTNGTLTYTTEQKGFEFADAPYQLNGIKVTSQQGVITSVDNGTVQKNGLYIGNFYVRYEDGTPKVSVNNMETLEMLVVIPKINELLEKLAE